jgi:hypothetical protein
VKNNNIGIKAAMHFVQMLIDSYPCRMRLSAVRSYIHIYILHIYIYIYIYKHIYVHTIYIYVHIYIYIYIYILYVYIYNMYTNILYVYACTSV